MKRYKVVVKQISALTDAHISPCVVCGKDTYWSGDNALCVHCAAEPEKMAITFASVSSAREKAEAVVKRARDFLDPELVECVRKRGYFECECAKSAVTPHCLHCLYPKWIHDVAAALEQQQAGNHA